MFSKFLTCLLCLSAIACFSSKSNAYVTQTVYGFLDFTTTIGDTVMVFSPHSAPDLNIESKTDVLENTIKTEPFVSGSQQDINPTKHSSYNVASEKNLAKSQSDIKNSSFSTIKLSTSSSAKPSSSSKAVASFESNVNQPEYDFLSRQPSEFVEESYRVISHKSVSDQTPVVNYNKKPHDNRKKKLNTVGRANTSTPSDIKNGVNAQNKVNVVHSEKHTQAIQSHAHKNNKSPIRPSSSLRILKTASPSQQKVSLSPSGVSNRPTHSTNRLRKNHIHKSTSNDVSDIETPVPHPEETTSSKKGRSRNKSKRRNKSSTNKLNLRSETSSRRSSRSKIQASPTEADISTSLFMLKLNRAPGRWQYKTSPKPRVSIRKALSESTVSPAAHELELSSVGNNEFSLENPSTFLGNGDLESSGSQNGPILNNVNQESKQLPFVETLNVEISTPDDFKSTYYEIATIKTPYTFQVGLLKKTRFITVTSTFEKTIPAEPTVTVHDNKPLIENILTSSLEGEHSIIESSITYLSPIHLDSKAVTPSLETVIETYSTTLTKFKTQVLPFILDDSNETSYTTLTQTYDITTIIAATKTISPFDDNHFEASRNFKDFNAVLDEAGSEINLELEFGDTDNAEVLHDDKQFVSELPISSTESKKSHRTEDQKQQTAPIPIFPPQGLSTILTTSQPYVVQETLWESHVVPIVNGLSTNYRTLSKSVGNIDKTHYKLVTSTILLPNVPPPQISVNPYLIPQEFQTITSPIVQQTVIPQTQSKILKLTFGAKTAYTTIYSTLNVPTAVTMFVTTAVPVQPSAAFPGYFAPPFHPFQFVG